MMSQETMDDWMAINACIQAAEDAASEESFSRAERLYEQAVLVAELTCGPQHAGVAFTLARLADFCDDRGRHHEAEELYRKALDTARRMLDPRDPVIGFIMRNLAEVCERQGNYEEAAHLRNAARPIFARLA